MEIREFLDYLHKEIQETENQYDIMKIGNFISGYNLNTRFEFPIKLMNEKVSQKYQCQNCRNFYSILSYYGGKEAVNIFFDLAQNINLRYTKKDEISFWNLYDLIKNIKMRPYMFLQGNGVDGINQIFWLLKGYFFASDEKKNYVYGTTEKKFMTKFDFIVSEKYSLNDKISWNKKIIYGTPSGNKMLDDFFECCNIYFNVENLN